MEARHVKKQRKPIPRMSAKTLKARGGPGKVFSTIAPKVSSGKPYIRGGNALKKVGAGKVKREARNAAYYKSAEWRDVKKRTHEVDGYRCTMTLRVPHATTLECGPDGALGVIVGRCENRGENVNGKYTARGLTCDEITYQRRGDGSKGSGTHEPGITTRSLCARCNATATTQLRANHTNGFQNRRGS